MKKEGEYLSKNFVSTNIYGVTYRKITVQNKAFRHNLLYRKHTTQSLVHNCSFCGTSTLQTG
jgi:hypothetical protein